VDTTNEQEVLRSILSSAKVNEEDSERKAELRKIRQRRKMTASYKAHKTLEVLYPEQYKRLFNQAYEILGADDRYTETV